AAHTAPAGLCIANPDGPIAHDDRLRVICDTDRGGYFICLRIDARNRFAAEICNPYRAFSGRKSCRSRPDLNGLNHVALDWINASDSVARRIRCPDGPEGRHNTVGSLIHGYWTNDLV